MALSKAMTPQRQWPHHFWFLNPSPWKGTSQSILDKWLIRAEVPDEPGTSPEAEKQGSSQWGSTPKDPGVGKKKLLWPNLRQCEHQNNDDPRLQHTGFLKIIFFFFFCHLTATPMTYGSSRAKGWTGAAIACLCYSNARSEPCLWPTLLLTATPDPYPTEQGQTSNPSPHGY